MSTQKLFVDDGLIRLDINGNGILAFNPSDFNVYERFYALTTELAELEKKYIADVEELPEGTDQRLAVVVAGRELSKAREIDREVKAKLSAAFGGNNDFDQLLGGVNVMAYGSNGERIITNLLNAIVPYIEEGVKKHTQTEVEEAKRNREARRAAQRGRG